MIIADSIYGEEKIEEPVLTDLINSKAIQRLKNISQQGLPREYYHLPVFSRYEHSVGVLILLKRLNACLEEQIAGLLHDTSHTAFSHVIDWVIGDPNKEDYQDQTHSKFIENSDIKGILESYKIDFKEVSDVKNFSLLEREIPHLCVDRFDYAIREIKLWANPSAVNLCVGNIENKNRCLVFSSQEAAEVFAVGYMRCQKEHWAGDEAKARYHILAEILRKAIRSKIISIDDMQKTDMEVIRILENSKEKDILDGLNLLKKGFLIEKTDTEDFIELHKKFRYIDPEVLVDGKIRKLSDVSSGYRNLLKKKIENSKVVIKIKIKGLKEQDKR